MADGINGVAIKRQVLLNSHATLNRKYYICL